jgi:hypothetical protein
MSFDLTIDNYNKAELMDMFDLPSNYDTYIVEQQETKLKDIILNNNDTITLETRNKIIYFLKEAKKILLNDISHKTTDLTNVTISQQSGHDIQERPDQPYLLSVPTNYVKGVINPLKRRVNTRYLNIDTRFRENYFSCQSTNYHLDLPLKISGVMSLQLSAIELPTTFFNISKQLGNNFFTIEVDDYTIGTETKSYSTVITIQNGNYAPSSLIDYLNSIVGMMVEPFNRLIFTDNILNTMISGTGQMIVGISKPYDPFNFTLNFQADKNGNNDNNTPLPLKLGWILGFRSGKYVNNYTYISEGIMDLTGPRYIYLVVDDFNNNVNNAFYGAFNSSILNKNILARISLQSKFFDIFIENNLNVITTPRHYYGPVDIQKLHLQLLDEYGRVLDINNMDYSFCLILQTVYDI